MSGRSRCGRRGLVGRRSRRAAGRASPVDGGASGATSAGRVDAHRRVAAGGEEDGRYVLGGTVNGNGALTLGATASATTPPSAASRASSRRPRAPRRRSSAWPTGWRPCSCRSSWSSRRSRASPGSLGPSRAWWRERGRHRADHRLPLRAGAGHADGGHGRHRPRAERHPDPQRARRSRRPGGSTCALRQDRHAHRGEEPRGDVVVRGRGTSERLLIIGSGGRRPAREHPLGRAVVAEAAAREVGAVGGRGVRGRTRGRRRARSRQSRDPPGGPRRPWPARASRYRPTARMRPPRPAWQGRGGHRTVG